VVLEINDGVGVHGEVHVCVQRAHHLAHGSGKGALRDRLPSLPSATHRYGQLLPHAPARHCPEQHSVLTAHGAETSLQEGGAEAQVPGKPLQ
jgi:hypothetical protein